VFRSPISISALLVSVVLVLLCGTGCSQSPSNRADGLKAGVATEKITPTEMPFWLSGYAARKTPANEVKQDIYAKALALEDASGNRSVIVTLDLIGVPKAMRDSVSAKVQQQFGLDPKALMLNSSHTHSGPAVRQNLEILFQFTDDEKARAQRYRDFLEGQVVTAVGKALQNIRPVTVAYGVGSAPFAANRRALRFLEEDPNSNPVKTVDHSVPVLRVQAEDGSLLAVLFGYACHNTTLTGEFNAVAGDYAGFAQQELQTRYPGTTAMFVMLCGGDQNPEPRSQAELAQTHGRTLADSVAATLGKEQELLPVRGEVRSALRMESLPFESFTRQQFEEERGDKNIYKKRRAEWMLGRMDRGEDVSAISYPIQVLRIGSDFGIVGLGGEVVVDYALDIKKANPKLHLMVAGYTNDVMGYIPNQRILAEGGYEADESMIYYGQPTKLKPEVEDRLKDGVAKAIAEVGFVQ